MPFLQKSQRGRFPAIVPKIAWGVIAFCGALLGTTIFVDEFLRASHIGQYINVLTSERHVTESQKAKIKEYIEPIAVTFPRALSVAAADNPEANGYAVELMIAFGLAGLKIETINSFTLIPHPMHAMGTGVKGVFFQVRDPENLPADVTLLRNALKGAGIETKIYQNPQLGEGNYVFTVGLK